MLRSHDESSDEEIFIGKLTLKEVKKHILGSSHCEQKQNLPSKNSINNKIKIIETISPVITNKNDPIQSQKPELNSVLSPITPELFSDWDIKNADDSFLRVEKIVSQSDEKTKELDNTLEIVNYIMNNAPPHIEPLPNETSNKQNTEIQKHTTENKHLSQSEVTQVSNLMAKSPKLMSPTTHITKISKAEKENYITPSKNDSQKNFFKTPGQPVSQKKSSVTSSKKTVRNITYQHVASPVAEYIRNIPSAANVKDIRPIKTTSCSSIPKLIKTPSQNKVNREIHLQKLGISAKKSKVVNGTNEVNIQNVLKNKQSSSSLPRPVM